MDYKLSIKTKIIISFTIVGVLLILAFSILTINTIYKNGTEEIKKNADKTLENSFNATRIMLSSLNANLFSSYNTDYDVIKALYSKEFTTQEMNDIHKKLKELIKSSPIIDSIYIYNSYTNMVFSSYSAASSPEYFVEEDIVDLIRTYVNNDKAVLMPRKVVYQYEPPVPYQDDEQVTIVYTTCDKGREPKEGMIVNISNKELQTLVNQKTVYDSNRISLLVNNYGDIITSSDKIFDMDSIIDEDFADKVLKAENNSGSFDAVVNDVKSVVTFIKYPVMGCVFVNIDSYQGLMRNVNEMLMVISTMTLVFIILGIIGTLYFTRMLYKPLGNIVKDVRKSDYTSVDEYLDEYDFVSRAVKNMDNKIHDLIMKINKYFPTRKNNLLKSILYGNLTEIPTIEQFRNEYQIVLSENSFVVLIIKPDNLKKSVSNSELEEFIHEKLMLTKKILDGFKGRYEIEIVDDMMETIPVIVSLSEEDRWMEKIRGILLEVNTEYRDKYDRTFSTAIGSRVFNIRDIRKSFMEATEVVKYRIIHGRGKILCLDDTGHTREYNYPYNIEKLLMEKLLLSDKEEIKTLVDKFFSVVSKFEYNEIFISFSQLILMIIRTSQVMNEFETQEMRINYINMQQKFNEFECVDEIKEWILSMLFRIIETRDTQLQKRNHKIAAQIADYIDNHYHDANLSVEMLTDPTGFSQNYVRNIFKSVMGVSISDYINMTRFENAKHLLLSTKYSAKKIAEMVGFQSSDYFYYSFRKNFGKSPSQYRSQSKVNKQGIQ